MRIAVIGAGAVGGVTGGLLHLAGHDVALVARGAHLAAIRERGLVVETPSARHVCRVPAVEDAAALPFVPEVALVATKVQDVEGALRGLDPAVPVACAQNGLEGERIALRRADRVYGVLVWMPASHLEPGVVTTFSTPPGLLDVGRVPLAEDPFAEALAGALRSAGLLSEARADILAWKQAKLLTNLGNAFQAACGLEARDPELLAEARAEALACFAAAGMRPVPEAAFLERVGALTMRPVAGRERGGGSTWQSLARATGTAEVDWLNGEIALLGRLHGIPTPVNVALQRAVDELARTRRPPGSLTPAELRIRAGR